jgi:predicted esterase
MLHGAGGIYSPELNASRDNFGEHQLACSGRVAVLVHYLDVSKVRFAPPGLIQRDAKLWVEVVKAAVGVATELPFVKHNNLSLLGESLGGYLGLAVALDDKRVKNVFILAGGFASDYTATIANHPRVVMFHGSDDSVIPLESAQKDCAALRAKELECTLRVLPGAGHVLSPASVRSVIGEVVRLTADRLWLPATAVFPWRRWRRFLD